MSNQGPCIHSVHFYQSPESLMDRLTGIVCSGLLVGNSVLIVARKSNRQRLSSTLERLNIDVREHAREARFSMYDAEQLLESFMVGAVPDSELFQNSVGRAIRDAHAAIRGKESRVTVFGEMVSLLWEAGNRSGAIALEQLWNQALSTDKFNLHCAYPSYFFEEDSIGAERIRQLHTHSLEWPSAA